MLEFINQKYVGCKQTLLYSFYHFFTVIKNFSSCNKEILKNMQWNFLHSSHCDKLPHSNNFSQLLFRSNWFIRLRLQQLSFYFFKVYQPNIKI